jgi:L-aminopeptidase/D-esterase-like protein
MINFAGIRIGHATHPEYHTGCTVFLCPDGTYGSVDARGPATGSRELTLLAPDKPDDKEIDAVVLTGGSAFGLATADGVMRFLAERGIGHPTPIRPVPIVSAGVVFDLGVNPNGPTPDAAMGYAACEAAERWNDEIEQGNVGAGAGVFVGKWAGFPHMMKGGFGVASLTIGEVVVAAAAVVNAVGDVVNDNGTVLAGARDENGWLVERFGLRYIADPLLPSPATNTTLVLVATNAILSRSELYRLTHQAHNGMALAVRPSHTRHDGDMAFALSTARVKESIYLIGNMTVKVVAEAIRNGVRQATSVAGFPGLAG